MAILTIYEDRVKLFEALTLEEAEKVDKICECGCINLEVY